MIVLPVMLASRSPWNSGIASSKRTSLVMIFSISTGIIFSAICSQIICLKSLGRVVELTPSRFTPLKIKGITFVESLKSAASPMLATFPSGCVALRSQDSVSPPRLSIAPPKTAFSSAVSYTHLTLPTICSV